MANLISGKEALIALANGEDVEYLDTRETFKSSGWTDAKGMQAWLFIQSTDGLYKFRLKPRTITINGVEVPACGVDYKPHTYMFVLNSLETCEYSRIMLDESAEIPHYWWSTEDEIKQVVAALRQVFGEV